MALEYAHRHLPEVGVAWQVHAEDSPVLAAGFSELAAQLGARDLLDTRDAVATVHAVLAAYPADWLLVFDNAPDRASIAAFVPPVGPGRVLITSRSQNWPTGQALRVPVLELEAAADFMVHRSGDPDRAAALALAAQLGCLPLALEQAAAYIEASFDGTLAQYLESFRQLRADMLSRGQPTGYSETVATTWRLAFEDLQQAAPGAVGLLRLLAFCAPEAISLRLLLQPRPGLAGRVGQEVAPVLVPLLGEPLAVSDALIALRRYSLVTPAADGLVSVHRLVQAFTVDQMSTELARQWHQAAATLIEAALPKDQRQPEAWPAYALLLPHAQATLAPGSVGMWRVADYLGNSGSYAAAVDMSERILQARLQTKGAEHPDTLAARASVAFWTGQAGDAAAARDQYAELVPVDERVLGPEQPDTLLDRASLARWTGQAGDAATARDQLAELLPVMERVLGPEHPETLTARNNLASWTGEAGDAAGARD